MKTLNYTGIDFINKIADVKRQTGKEINTITAVKLLSIERICSTRKMHERVRKLEDAGFYVAEKRMRTGDGVGTCYKLMKTGDLRIRVSANWGGKFGNYALCVHV